MAAIDKGREGKQRDKQNGGRFPQNEAAGLDEVLIYHGIGTGRLSSVVRDFLKQHPKVVEFLDAPPKLGGFGAKIVRL